MPRTVDLPPTNKMVVSAVRGQLGCCGMTRHALAGPQRLLAGKGMLFLRASPTSLERNFLVALIRDNGRDFHLTRACRGQVLSEVEYF